MSSEDLVQKHPCRERIEKLLSGAFDPNASNCFGTVLYLVGVNPSPTIVSRDEMQKFLRECRKVKIPSSQDITLVCSQWLPNAFPIHSSVYLGRESKTSTIVEQLGVSAPYRIIESNWDDFLFGPHFYRFNP